MKREILITIYTGSGSFNLRADREQDATFLASCLHPDSIEKMDVHQVIAAGELKLLRTYGPGDTVDGGR